MLKAEAIVYREVGLEKRAVISEGLCDIVEEDFEVTYGKKPENIPDEVCVSKSFVIVLTLIIFDYYWIHMFF